MSDSIFVRDTGAASAGVARTTLFEIAALVGAARAQPGRAAAPEWFPVRTLRRGDAVFRAGDRFQSLYVVRCGLLKTRIQDGTGAEQVLAFPMRGDALGADGVGGGAHTHDAVALDAASVAILNYARLTQSMHADALAGDVLLAILGQEMARANELLITLGGQLAPARLATFVLRLSRRLAARGFSETSLQLRMSRGDIASHLGLTVETVSRNFSLFARRGLIAVKGNDLRILDAPGLEAIAHAPAHERPDGRGSSGACPSRARTGAPAPP